MRSSASNNSSWESVHAPTHSPLDQSPAAQGYLSNAACSGHAIRRQEVMKGMGGKWATAAQLGKAWITLFQKQDANQGGSQASPPTHLLGTQTHVPQAATPWQRREGKCQGSMIKLPAQSLKIHSLETRVRQPMDCPWVDSTSNRETCFTMAEKTPWIHRCPSFRLFWKTLLLLSPASYLTLKPDCSLRDSMLDHWTWPSTFIDYILTAFELIKIKTPTCMGFVCLYFKVVW